MTVLDKLNETLEGIDIRFDEPLKTYTYTKVGGKADYLVFPRNRYEMARVVKFANQENIPWMVLGNASNIIVREGGAAVNPVEDKEIIDTELQLKDLETIEAQLAKQQKVAAAGNKDAKVMVAVLEAYKAVLEQGKNARSVQFDSKEEQQAAHDLFLLTTKPVLYVCNVDENSAKDGNEYSKQVERIAAEEGAEAMIIAAKTEEDIASLESYEDKKLFLDELGLEQSGVNRLINKAYHLLNLQTFITAGEMEVKAWTFHKGWKAPQCAGVIHTDFEKGFIRAEVIKYEDYLKYGSEAAVREAGKLGVEGKEYIVQDGDIMHFRFNV